MRLRDCLPTVAGGGDCEDICPARVRDQRVEPENSAVLPGFPAAIREPVERLGAAAAHRAGRHLRAFRPPQHGGLRRWCGPARQLPQAQPDRAEMAGQSGGRDLLRLGLQAGASGALKFHARAALIA